MSDDGNKLATTFFSKSDLICPVCGEKFKKEELMTGSGRLNAGELTEELRRLYIPSKKYGEVNPLIYYIVVCPKCLYSASPVDFPLIKGPLAVTFEKKTKERIAAVKEIFPKVNFNAPRTLIEGLVSYYLAIIISDDFPLDLSPVIKGGIYCLRSAWICNDLHAKFPNENYDYLANNFYRKAGFYYLKAIKGEQDGTGGIGGVKNLGPDLDKNFGYDGVLYLGAYLSVKFRPKENDEERHTAIINAKRIVARIFGMGKASKNKPAAIIDNAKKLYDQIKTELKE